MYVYIKNPNNVVGVMADIWNEYLPNKSQNLEPVCLTNYGSDKTRKELGNGPSLWSNFWKQNSNVHGCDKARHWIRSLARQSSSYHQSAFPNVLF
jgi:hypothetical protein